MKVVVWSNQGSGAMHSDTWPLPMSAELWSWEHNGSFTYLTWARTSKTGCCAASSERDCADKDGQISEPVTWEQSSPGQWFGPLIQKPPPEDPLLKTFIQTRRKHDVEQGPSWHWGKLLSWRFLNVNYIVLYYILFNYVVLYCIIEL